MKLNIVPPRTGMRWVALGLKTFVRQPLALAGLFFMYFMAMTLLGLVPVIGAPAAFLLAPAATLGIMAAAGEAAEGRFPMPTILLSAFRAGPQKARAMLVLGVIYTVLLLGVALVVSLAAGGPSAMPGGAAGASAPAAAASAPADMQAALGQAQLSPALLLLAAVQLPLLVVFAHAPALVHWHGLTPVKSLFFSAVAFVRNLGAFLVFGLLWMAVLAGALLVFGILLHLLGAKPSVGNFMPLALIVASMGTCSMFFTFRDCYHADEPAVPAADHSA